METLSDEEPLFDDFFPLSPLSGEFDAVSLHGKNYFVSPVNEFDFSKADAAFFISTPDETQRLLSKAQNAGCIVIDDSHLYAADPRVPLILPELNQNDLNKAVETRLVIPAAAVTTQLCLALAPLHDNFEVEHCTVTALESVSEHGRVGTETLARETTLLLNGTSAEHEGFPAQLAINLHTRIGDLQDDNYSEHENTVKAQTQRILGAFSRGLDVTCMQVPVFYGHTLSIHVDLQEKASVKELEEAFAESEYLSLIPSDKVLTPVTDAVTESKILITRVRQDGRSGKAFSFIALMDNSRRGEAVSCVRIAQLLRKKLG